MATKTALELQGAITALKAQRRARSDQRETVTVFTASRRKALNAAAPHSRFRMVNGSGQLQDVLSGECNMQQIVSFCLHHVQITMIKNHQIQEISKPESPKMRARWLT